MKHLLSIESLSAEEILRILDLSAKMKAERGRHDTHPLRHQCWALIFSKSSTRTRVSFEVGIRELGGDVLFLNANDIQLGRGEPIKDTARVMGRMLHGAVIRTFAQSDVETFREILRAPDDQCAHRRRASLPDSRRSFHDPGKAGRFQGTHHLLHRRRRVQRAPLMDMGGGEARLHVEHRRAGGIPAGRRVPGAGEFARTCSFSRI